MPDEPWDQEDEHRLADFEHMLARMGQDRQERIIEAAETALHLTSSADFPMPNTAHPALERYAETVRGMNQRQHTIRIPILRSPTASFDPQPSPTSIASDTLTLSVRKAAAPAPFVGDARWNTAYYMWRFWTDDYGRGIATDAELVWRVNRGATHPRVKA